MVAGVTVGAGAPDSIPFVFISFSHHNRGFVGTLADRLERANVAVWFDANRSSTEQSWAAGLRPGDDFASTITDAIRACRMFIIVLSPASNASRWVALELALAHHFQRPIIPLLHDGLRPRDLSTDLLPYLVRLHHHPLEAASGDWAALLDTVRERLNASVSPQPHPVANVPQERAAAPSTMTAASKLVTCAEYAAFVSAGRKRRGTVSGIPTAAPDAPVTRVSWEDALAYCDGLGGRLPTSLDFPVSPGSSADLVPLEWSDGGSPDARQVRESRTGIVRGIFPPDFPLATAGFRCLPAAETPSPVWIPVAGGEYVVGFDNVRYGNLFDEFRISTIHADSLRRRSPAKKRLSSFEISKDPVTNGEFWSFARENPEHWPRHWNRYPAGPTMEPFPARLRCMPVANVSADGARQYCAFAGVSLPTWYEWEVSASGGGNAYPWGNEYSPAICNDVEAHEGGLVSVDHFPAGNSTFGARQLAGNVFEWVSSPVEGKYEIRGGSFRVPCRFWGLASVFRSEASSYTDTDVGFRVVRRKFR